MKIVALFICTIGCNGNQCCPSINAVDMGICCGTDLWGMWILRVLLGRVSVSSTLLLHLKEVLSEMQCDEMFVMLLLSYVSALQHKSLCWRGVIVYLSIWNFFPHNTIRVSSFNLVTNNSS